MKRILFILYLICYCISTSAQLRDYNVHYYISKNWQGIGKAPVSALYFDGYTLYHCGYSTTTGQDISLVKRKAITDRPDFDNAVLRYNSTYSNSTRTVYVAENLEYPKDTGRRGPGNMIYFEYPKDGSQFISISNDMSEFIETNIAGNETHKYYFIEVPESYLTDKSPRINKSFVNE